jgi:hypothetical protein
MGHQARTNNSEEQEQAKAKCGGPSTDHPNEQVRSSGTPVAAAKYAASGRDDGFILFPAGMTGYRLRAVVGMTGYRLRAVRCGRERGLGGLCDDAKAGLFIRMIED